MTDYTELIRSLRNCSNNRCAPCDCGWFDKYQVDESCKEIIMWKAAAAIEALQAEQKKTVTQIFGEEQMAWEGRCKDLMKYISDLQAKNKELHGRIEDEELKIDMLTADSTNYENAIEELKAQLPKRGEIVRCKECRWGHLCVTGQHLGLDGFCSKGEREVQE